VADPNGWGDLIQIAAPDTSSNAAKRRTNMSVPATFATESVTEVETTLSNSSSYIETLTLKTIAAQPWLTDLVIKTQLLAANNPLEKRVKVRCCIEKEQLVKLRNALDQYLKEYSTKGGQK
jgi:hypothetical protein